ncbi:MAG TPA: ABC transporter permease, partial [Candidatus Saccharicenans sp.]|nr:ABC transporter permease [Candidatus Saccharicenans sp.]
IAFLFQPVSAVFYPLSVLPDFLQVAARFVPASYVFEGMRAVIMGQSFPAGYLVRAMTLNLIYLILVLLFFFRMFKAVRVKGLLVHMGE